MNIKYVYARLVPAVMAALAGLWLQDQTVAQLAYEPRTFVSFAGHPEAGAGYFDGLGQQARFNAPAGIARDAAGNFYVADLNNHTIRKVTSTGIVSTVAGAAGSFGSADGVGAAARFTGPQDVAVDRSGNMFIADSYNHTIRKITPAGVVSTVAGLAGSTGSADGVGSAARFDYPLGVEVDSAGVLFVADCNNHTIRRIATDGTVSTLCGTPLQFGSVDGAGSAARLAYPQDLVVDNAGILYVADGGNHTIRKVTPAGVVSTFVGAGGVAGSGDGIGGYARFNYPAGVALGSGGKLYVTEIGNHIVRQVTPLGIVTTLAGKAQVIGSDDGVGSAARFNFPLGVVADGDRVVVVDAYNYALRRISATAAVTTFVGWPVVTGSTDGPAADARFNYPEDVAVDSDGTVYVADQLNSTIRKIAGGVVSTLAGLAGSTNSIDGVGTAARFNRPVGVAARDGVVYVADTGNHTIRKITADGRVSTLAGSPGVSGSADGTGATARFSGPFRLTVDAAGFVYVADTGNHLIRKVTPAGLVTTLAGKAGSAGSADGVGTDASFYAPEGIAVDRNGNVYVADDGNQTIRKITPAGVVSVFAGATGLPGAVDGVGGTARFSYPYGLAVDANNNLYVADSGSQTVRKITPDGNVTTLAGAPGLVGYVDGTGKQVQFALPSGVAVDKEGTLYVADTAIHAIRKGIVPLPDAPIVDPAGGRAGTLRQFDIINPATTSWSWTMIRCPATASTQLWSAAIRNPTLTPDVDDLYVVRLRGWDPLGRVAVRTLTLSGANASLLILGINRSSPGAFDLHLDGPAGTTGAVEYSEDLSSWTSLMNFSITNAPARWSEIPAGGTGRFYRATAR